MAKFFVKKGSIVTCPEGHRLYKIRRHIKRGECVPARAEDFEPLRGVKPLNSGDKMTPCPICGHEWFRFRRGGFKIHLEGGWAK